MLILDNTFYNFILYTIVNDGHTKKELETNMSEKKEPTIGELLKDLTNNIIERDYLKDRKIERLERIIKSQEKAVSDASWVTHPDRMGR